MSQIPRVQIRQPATANLMVDSADRSSGYYGDFTINRTNSILNGFFHRIGVTEMVLEWNQPNITPDANTVTVVVGGTPYSVGLATGFYTVESAFAALLVQLNNTVIPGITTWTFTLIDGIYELGADVAFAVANTPLAVKLNIYNTAFDAADARPVIRPDLRPYRYIDIISPNLTYNQKLKDASTALDVRDVLVRWYFAWDEAPVLDGNGFPILMGYTPFSARRIYSPPKQIRWENNMPVGQIKFEVYGDDGNLVTRTLASNNFLMTLQACED
jgi:hypothetical protein